MATRKLVSINNYGDFLHEIFPIAEEIGIGDYIADDYALVENFEAQQIDILSQSDGSLDHLESFHDYLLGLAVYALNEDSAFFPLVGVVIGVIAKWPCSLDRVSQIEELLKRLDRRFNAMEGDPLVNLLKAETYFCAARMIGHETFFATPIHGLFESAFDTVSTDNGNGNIGEGSFDYTGFMAVAAVDESRYACATSLIREHFEATVGSYEAENCAEDVSTTHIIENLRLVASLGGDLAGQLPDGAGLEKSAVAAFAKSWDALHCLDPEVANKTLAFGQEACGTFKNLNAQFKNAVMEKSRILRGLSPHPAKAHDAPKPNAAGVRERMMETKLAATPLLARLH